jgi:protocatechuate 3,4-dioxygenase beta subunit
MKTMNDRNDSDPKSGIVLRRAMLLADATRTSPIVAPFTLDRRRLLQGLGATLVAAPWVSVLGCGSSKQAGQLDTSPLDAGVPRTDASQPTTGADAQSATESAAAWSTGGTAAMSGNYRDPFVTGLGAACAVTCSATLGPCYAKTMTRRDISEGQAGLPVRLAFLLVDETCTPIENASVDIWHTSPAGLYSGDDASDFCTSGDATARAARWFRGVQTSDARGRVDFDSCFPGWYSGRTIHIHFTVRIADAEYVTSQLVFDDALNDEIVNGQALYNARGPRDTRNTTDSVFSADSVPDYTFQTERQLDGALLAWKTLVIRSSTDAALCAVPGGSMGGAGRMPRGDAGLAGPPFGGAGPRAGGQGGAS